MVTAISSMSYIAMVQGSNLLSMDSLFR